MIENETTVAQKSIAYENVIKSISYDQKEILFNIMQLHNNGEGFEADMTYSSGKFYEPKTNDKFIIPVPPIKMDVFPQSDDIMKIEPLGKLPLEDNSINSIVIDLPFIISPPNAPSMQNGDNQSNIIGKRFHSYYPVAELLESYHHWIGEAYRVLKDDGICVFKTQGCISGGKSLWTPEYSWLCAIEAGFYVKDQWFLIAKNRLHSGKVKKQEHSRKYTSTFFIFKKHGKKKFDHFAWMSEEQRTKFFGTLSHKIK